MRLNFKISVLLPAILICFLSLLVLYSTTSNQFNDQLKYLIIGVGVFVLISSYGGKIIKINATGIFILCIILNIIPILFGPEIRGSRRWIDFGFTNFQTSEALKFGFVIYLSSVFSITNVNKFSMRVLYSFLLIGVSLLLVFLEPDLGTVIVLGLMFLSVLVFSGIQLKRLGLLFILILILAFPLFLSLKEYQRERIISFLNPTHDVLGSNYNVNQAIIAIGSGGLLGRGYGMGSQSHLRFLPEYHTDFIFAAFIEEWGILFGILLLLLYGIIFYSIFTNGSKCTSSVDVYINFCILAYFFWHIAINIGMNLGILPVTGIPLPFMSYGGSSLITSFAILGLVSFPKQING